MARRKKGETPTPKEIRAKTGLSQVKFGRQYGIPRRTIEDWEADLHWPPEYVLRLLDRAVEEDFPG